MPLLKNQMVPLTINALSSDGNGIGRHDGQVVFVPAAAVGDELRVKIVKPAKKYAYGRIEQVVTLGPAASLWTAPWPTAAAAAASAI